MVIVAMTDQVTCGTISHVQLGHVQQTDTCNKCTDVQNMCNKHMNHKKACDECMNGLNTSTTHSNNQSDKRASNTNMHDNETT